MEQSNHRLHQARRQSWIATAGTSALLSLVWPGTSFAQIPYQTRTGEMVMFQSAAASKVVEEVRSECQGVMCEVFVKAGDTVKKGQILGHTELDATKLQLDLAQHALESKANVDAAESQAEAWTVTREETEEAVRRRQQEQTRLEWAIAMEKMYHANYEVQLDAEKAQQIQYDYWKDQYDKRFFRAPVDGLVSKVLVPVGKPVGLATHVFTISNDSAYSLPVTVPAPLADAAATQETIPIRAADGKSVSRALVDSVIDDPAAAGRKIIRLLIKAADFPAAMRGKLMGMKFDVLLPQLASASDVR